MGACWVGFPSLSPVTSPQTPEAWLTGHFPRLQTETFAVTSPDTPRYNCIAWAAGDTTRWWWPPLPFTPGGSYWPAGAPTSDSLDTFVVVFRTLGYEVCASDDPVDGLEKVALYCRVDGSVTHAARQLPNGQWTSKCGRGWDISHLMLESLEAQYGTVQAFLVRPRNPSS